MDRLVESALRIFPTPKHIKDALKISRLALDLCGMSYGKFVSASLESRIAAYTELHGRAPNKEVMKKLEVAL